MYKLEYLPVALHDMSEISEYISKELKNPQAAVKLTEKFIESTEALRKFPYANQVYQPIRPLKYEYRRAVIVNYLLFYRVNEEAKEVIVARVIYGKRHLERQIKGNET